jgi:hypothetical protein
MSRTCEEFALERRRRGCDLVVARQAKTNEAPHRVLAELLTGLAGAVPGQDVCEEILAVLRGYDADLVERVRPVVRSIFGMPGRTPSDDADSALLSAFLVLVVARCRRSTLVVHLQDLHWCGAEACLLLERLLVRLGHTSTTGFAPEPVGGCGVLFILEGRVRESGEAGDEAWSSTPFESFLSRAGIETVTCGAFSPEDSREFVRLLFEGRHNAHRAVPDELLSLQSELVERVDESAGGNPFHTIEQIRHLRDRRIVGRNPRTGLLYLIQPDSTQTLPDSVFEAIEHRWHYLREQSPEAALLVWACALVEDQLPAAQFAHLWQALAPFVSRQALDRTEILWTGNSSSNDVVFRHENYFESLRRFTVTDHDRSRVVDAYEGWFAKQPRLG